MLIDGLVVMGIGMSVVFSFLIILVIAMGILAKVMPILNDLMPEEIQEQNKITKVVEQNDEIAVVIAAVKALG